MGGMEARGLWRLLDVVAFKGKSKEATTSFRQPQNLDHHTRSSILYLLLQFSSTEKAGEKVCNGSSQLNRLRTYSRLVTHLLLL